MAIAWLVTTLAATTGPSLAEWTPAGERIKTRWAAEVTPDNAWREYPRPQMVREDWHSLNGLWDFVVRPKKDAEPPQAPDEWKGRILVPYCIESSLSGVGHLLEPDEELWYRRSFEVEAKGQRVLLHFEAVDYECEAWVNGKSVGTHKGGNTPFTFDVAGAAVDGENTLLLRVLDSTGDFQLRGKQVLKPGGIMYTRVSGIWQSVWLETVPRTYIERLKIDTAIKPATITIRTFTGGDTAGKLSIRADPKDADWPQQAHEQFMFELQAMMDSLHNHPCIAGGIYTQTSDIEGEVNGLLTYDREVRKFAPGKLRELHAPLFEPGNP